MSPDSQAIQLVAIGAAVLAAVALGVTWTLTRGWWRALVRTGCAVLCVATAATAGLVWVNRQIDFYPTWASLLGNSTQAGGAAPLPDVTLPPAEAASHGAGRIETFTVAGKASKLTLPMYAYLPPGYDTHPTMRYPVVEALHGYPGTPLFWMTKLGVTAILDKEIAAGRMAPTVVLFPYQTPAPLLDTECTNLVGGPQTVETYRALGTLDEMRFLVLPIFTGAGRPLTSAVNPSTGIATFTKPLSDWRDQPSPIPVMLVNNG